MLNNVLCVYVTTACHPLRPISEDCSSGGDGDVSKEVPRVGLEEMLQEMNISDEGGEGERPGGNRVSQS